MTKEAQDTPGGAPRRPQNRAALQAQIDENLRRAYDAVLTEEVPDRFRDLLLRLQGVETPAPASAPASDSSGAENRPDPSEPGSSPPFHTGDQSR